MKCGMKLKSPDQNNISSKVTKAESKIKLLGYTKILNPKLAKPKSEFK